MKYVIDASVAFKWEVAEPWSNEARRLRDDYKQAIHELHAPDLFPTEIANALLVAERRGRIVAGQGVLLLSDLFATFPNIHPSYPDLVPRAYSIAAKGAASVYDCLYVALAEREQCELITGDDKLVRKLQGQFAFIKHVSTLP